MGKLDHKIAIVTGAAHQVIVARATDDRIRARTAVQRVIARTTIDSIGTDMTDKAVEPVAHQDPVIAGHIGDAADVKGIVPGRPRDVIAIHRQRLGPVHGIGRQPQAGYGDIGA